METDRTPDSSQTTCPHCQSSLDIDQQRVGRETRCPNCNGAVFVGATFSEKPAETIVTHKSSSNEGETDAGNGPSPTGNPEDLNAQTIPLTAPPGAANEMATIPLSNPPTIPAGGSPSPASEATKAWPAGVRQRGGIPTNVGDAAQTFGDYELLEEVARGGMGVVYRARQRGANRIVALKMILSGSLAGQEEVDRFYAEAEAAANLDHPNIVPVYDVGVLAGQHFFSMGFVDGTSLRDRISAKPMSSREAATIIHVLAEAVSYAHKNGIVHRDLKPANVLLDQGGRPRITDFGLAKQMDSDSELTASGQVMGTPSYMPPEQAAGQTEMIGPAVDIYALGAILYETLTGRPPFRAASAVETLRQVLDTDPIPPGQLNPEIDRDLETICLKCLAKQPGQRYNSAAELADELNRFLSGEPILARPLSAPARALRWCKRNPALATAALAAILFLLAGTAVSSYFAVIANARADSEFEQRTRAKKSAATATRRAEETKRALAEKEVAYDKLNRQLHVATAHRLAAQSQAILNDLPRTSLLLALEAIDATQKHGEPVVRNARQSLRDAMAVVGGTPLPDYDGSLAGFSSDGKFSVNSDVEGNVYLTELSNSKTTKLTGHAKWVTDFAFSHDSQRLATIGAEATARVWDLTADNPNDSPIVLLGHVERIMHVAFSRDGQKLMTGSDDTTARIWDLTADDPSAAPIVLRGHGEYVSSFAASPDGKWLAVGAGGFEGLPQDVKLWNLSAADPSVDPIVLKGHQETISGLAFTPDSKKLVSGNWDETLRVWDFAAEDVGASANARFVGVVNRLAMSPDGKTVATIGAEKGTIRLWSLSDDKPKSHYFELTGHTDSVDTLAFSPDGHTLVTGSDDKTVRVWDLSAENPNRTAVVLKGHDNHLSTVAISADGTRLMSASSKDHARIWNLDNPSNASSRVLSGHERGGVRSLEISPDGRWLATAAGGPARLWTMTLSGPSLPKVFGDKVYSVAFNSNSKKLVTIGFESALLWDVADDSEPTSLLEGQEVSPRACTICPNQRWLVIVSEGSAVRIWDLDDEALLTDPKVLSAGGRSISSSAIRRDGSQILFGHDDGSVTFWDLRETAPRQRRIDVEGHREPVYLVRFSRDEQFVITVSRDAARLWTWAADPAAMTSQVLEGHTSNIVATAFSPNGKLLVTGSHDNTARLWDLTADDINDSSIMLRGHDRTVRHLVFNTDGGLLITGSDDNTARLWNLDSADPNASSIVLRSHKSGIKVVQISPDDRYFVTGSSDRTARIWPLRISELTELARRIVGRELTQEERDVYEIGTGQ